MGRQFFARGKKMAFKTKFFTMSEERDLKSKYIFKYFNHIDCIAEIAKEISEQILLISSRFCYFFKNKINNFLCFLY